MEKEVNRKWIRSQVLVTMITTWHTKAALPSGTRATHCSSVSTSAGKRRQVVMLQCDPKDRGRLTTYGQIFLVQCLIAVVTWEIVLEPQSAADGTSGTYRVLGKE